MIDEIKQLYLPDYFSTIGRDPRILPFALEALYAALLHTNLALLIPVAGLFVAPEICKIGFFVMYFPERSGIIFRLMLPKVNILVHPNRDKLLKLIAE